MAATVIINRLTAAGPTTTDITGINTRANTTDLHDTDETANPIQIPTDAATKHSYWVVTRLEATVAPDTLIDNIEWFTDAANSFGTGVSCLGESASAYTQATGTAGDTGLLLDTNNYVSLAADPVSVFTFTSAAPNVIAGSTSTAIEFGDRMVYQIDVISTAGPGVTPTETWTWRFDET